MEMTQSKARKHKTKSLAYLPAKSAAYGKQNGVNLEGLFTADCVDFMATMPAEII